PLRTTSSPAGRGSVGSDTAASVVNSGITRSPYRPGGGRNSGDFDCVKSGAGRRGRKRRGGRIEEEKRRGGEDEQSPAPAAWRVFPFSPLLPLSSSLLALVLVDQPHQLGLGQHADLLVDRGVAPLEEEHPRDGHDVVLDGDVGVLVDVELAD